jgi:AcrR family transcriptional regulator
MTTASQPDPPPLPPPTCPDDESLDRGEARRRAMLETAGELFLERGFEGTSVGDVVRRSGGSLATLYRCFGSKEGLFAAIVDQLTTRVLGTFDPLELEALSLPETLQRFGERYLALVLAPDMLRWHRFCLTEGAQFPKLREALLVAGPHKCFSHLIEYLAAQMALGRLHAAEPQQAALHFVGLLDSENFFPALCGALIDTSPPALAQQVRRAVSVFLHGYQTPNTSVEPALRG